MGKLWERYLPASTNPIYRCSGCFVHLSLSDWLISKAFNGRFGRASLFDSVINVTLGPKEERTLATGVHIVSDIYCCKCDEYLGWFYYTAMEEDQRYKEGKFILEKGKIFKENQNNSNGVGIGIGNNENNSSSNSGL